MEPTSSSASYDMEGPLTPVPVQDPYRVTKSLDVSAKDPGLQSPPSETALSADIVDTHSEESILPCMRLLYLRTQRTLEFARTTRLCNVPSVYIARQALRLVLLLNEDIIVQNGPNEKQLAERSTLQGQIVDLKTRMGIWEESLGAGNGDSQDREYIQYVKQIEEQYDIFFEARFYSSAEEPPRGQVVPKLLSYHQKSSRLISRGSDIQLSISSERDSGEAGDHNDEEFGILWEGLRRNSHVIDHQHEYYPCKTSGCDKRFSTQRELTRHQALHGIKAVKGAIGRQMISPQPPDVRNLLPNSIQWRATARDSRPTSEDMGFPRYRRPSAAVQSVDLRRKQPKNSDTNSRSDHRVSSGFGSSPSSSFWTAVEGEPAASIQAPKLPTPMWSLGYVRSVAYSPDGGHVVSGSDDCTIRIWNTEKGVVVGGPFIGHTNGVRSVAWSPDGRYIVSGSEDRTIRIWDVETGTVVGEPFIGHTKAVRSIACSPDGRHIVSGSEDHTIRIWDAATGTVVGEPFTGHTKGVRCVAYSPDGRHVVSGSEDCTIRIWDVVTGMTVAGPLTGLMGWVYSVAYSPDGRHIVSGSFDKALRIWDAETGTAVGEPLREHQGVIFSAAYSPDGRHVVSGSEDRTVRIWDVVTGTMVIQLQGGQKGVVFSVAYSPDGRRIVSGSSDNTILIFDVETGRAIGEAMTANTARAEA